MIRSQVKCGLLCGVVTAAGLVLLGGLWSPVATAGESSSAVVLAPPMQAWFPKAPALPVSTENRVEVSTTEGLIQAVEHAVPGQTILLADGHYLMPRYIEILADRVTLRGASGHRERVILDGVQSMHGELLGIRGCSDVTIADLTIQNVRYNGFKVNSETNVQRLTIHNCIIHNIWQRGVKGVKVPEANREAVRPKSCRVQYCLFYNDRPKRLSDDPADIAQGNYIAGIDVMYAKDWIISDNVFVGIQGRTFEGRGAIFLWFDSQDCVVERNIIIDCDVGLQLGNAHRADNVQYHCVRCEARNNFITRAPEAGIVTVYTRDCRVLHNTIHDPQSRTSRLIRTVLTNEGLTVANNLLSGPGMSNESDSEIQFLGNLLHDVSPAFADPAHGNLHLTSAVSEIVDKAAVLPQPLAKDIDGHRRDDKPDIGADELVQCCLFRNAGQRSINLGGSTGLQFFRPQVWDYEARNITIAGNRFEGSVSPIAWVTADGGHVHHNTMVLPDKWALRILQETADARFQPCHGGVFEDNLVFYGSRVQVFVNVGPGTSPATFVFRRNVWCDVESDRRPSLPVEEQNGVYLSGVGAESYKRFYTTTKNNPF